MTHAVTEALLARLADPAYDGDCLHRIAAAALIREQATELAALKHDIERHVQIAAEQAEEIARLTPKTAMDDAIAAGDGTLHGAIDHWQREAQTWMRAHDSVYMAWDEEKQRAERAETALAEAKQELKSAKLKFKEDAGQIVSLIHERNDALDALALAQARIAELTDACNGVIGLVQLIAARDDLPPGLDDVMLLSYRMTEARRVTDAAMQEQK